MIDKTIATSSDPPDGTGADSAQRPPSSPAPPAAADLADNATGSAGSVDPGADVGAAPPPPAAEPLQEAAIRKTFAAGGALRRNIVRMACCATHPSRPSSATTCGMCSGGPMIPVDALVTPREVDELRAQIDCGDDDCLCESCIGKSGQWKPMAYRITGGQAPGKTAIIAARKAALWAARNGRGLLCVLADGDCGPNSLRACMALNAHAHIPSESQLREGAGGAVADGGWFSKADIAAAAKRAGVEAPRVVEIGGKDERVAHEKYTIDPEEAAMTGEEAVLLRSDPKIANPDLSKGAEVIGGAHAEGRRRLEDIER